MIVQAVSVPPNKPYSILWLKTDWDMPNLLCCIHLGDLPQKLFDTSVKKEYWKQLDPVFVMCLHAQCLWTKYISTKKNYWVE